jgi:acetate kinase
MFLVINIGSTSIKTHLIDHKLKSIAWCNANHIPADGWTLELSEVNGYARNERLAENVDEEAVISMLLGVWVHIVSDNLINLTAIGHRIVHSGGCYNEPTLLTPDIIDGLAELDGYAPSHNPFNRMGVRYAVTIFPNVPQYAVFDTAFHSSLPSFARNYAIPERLASQHHFYRYGFHGISCQHCLAEASSLLNKKCENLSLIVLHLGGGSSATAIRDGKSIDTSMGFSPVEGLVMSTRCGDIDPWVITTLLRQGWSVDQVEDLLTKQSGMFGLCGESDMRTILEQAMRGDQQAQLTLDLFCYRIKKYIGAYTAVLGRIDALMFTGGIGENVSIVREKILSGLELLGITMDPVANKTQAQKNFFIHSSKSIAKILVVNAQEEREIARQIAESLSLRQ